MLTFTAANGSALTELVIAPVTDWAWGSAAGAAGSWARLTWSATTALRGTRTDKRLMGGALGCGADASVRRRSRKQHALLRDAACRAASLFDTRSAACGLQIGRRRVGKECRSRW